MDEYQLVKLAHIISSTILFGTGIGTAFHGFVGNLSNDLRVKAAINRQVVLADFVFTTPAVILQPLTGLWLVMEAGFSLRDGWLLAAIVLYIGVLSCWLPVVWLQMRMRDMTQAALRTGIDLPPLYKRYARWWFALGWPAFAFMMAIFYLMVEKPDLPLSVSGLLVF
jgi:uncharacterized membrane protein